jgi:hypothetical protein
MMCARSQNTVARGCNSEGGVMKRDLYAEVSKPRSNSATMCHVEAERLGFFKIHQAVLAINK